MEQGLLEDHIDGLRGAYRERSAQMQRGLEQHFETWTTRVDRASRRVLPVVVVARRHRYRRPVSARRRGGRRVYPRLGLLCQRPLHERVEAGFLGDLR